MFVHNLGFPRIGLNRELKKATEAYWKGDLEESQLRETARDLRRAHWEMQRAAGVDLVPVGDFSLYDHILDVTAMIGAVPERFGWTGERVDLATFFRMARGEMGASAVAPMEMTKWFDANYHYIVPELAPGMEFRLSDERIFEHLEEARELGLRAKAVLPGPMTYVYLAKSAEEGFDRWDCLDGIVGVYEEVLRRLAGRCEWVELDEPILSLDLPEAVLARFAPVYEQLRGSAGSVKILLANFFGRLGSNAETALGLPVDALHLDLVRGAEELDEVLRMIPKRITLSLGVVDGRNIWRMDPDRAMPLIEKAVRALGEERVMLAPSCPMLHVPIDLESETALDPEIRSWMAYARQKCGELRLLADAEMGKDVWDQMAEIRLAVRNRRTNIRIHNPQVRQRLAGVTDEMAKRVAPYSQRREEQAARFGLPELPTTTIGSFPQTADIRAARARRRSGEISEQAYREAMQGFIRDMIERQERVGLDVLVHGEAERNDMVEYFGEQLEGFCFTRNGWVQSYGTRCVKPPIIFGDVSRPKPMTVEWSRYAQSLTDKPMKGMLTGPVTILCWSFVRDDQPRAETCRQIALAIRDEVQDLEAVGIGVIQIDEPALREGLPLRRSEWGDYLDWAVGSFRLATCCVRNETQIHTHMCYCEFNDIIEWIAALDADVISIEASRSKMELLEAFRRFDYPNEIGPGVYDIHSPRIPSADEMAELLRQAVRVIPSERLWVNPDCGLKTRGWAEVEESLRNMVEAARRVREEQKNGDREAAG